MAGLPLIIDLAGAPVLVVGGGEVAQRRIGELLQEGAAVTVVAPKLAVQVDGWADAGRLRHFPTRFADEQLEEPWALVIAATPDRQVNEQIAYGARRRRLLVNVVSDANLGNVAFPARVVRGSLQLAFTTGGSAPVLARKLRTLLEGVIPEALTAFITVAERERPRLKQQLLDLNQRRRVWERFFDAAWHGEVDAEQALHQALSQDDQPRLWLLEPPESTDQLSLRQLRQLQQAERVWLLGDVDQRLLDLCRRDAIIESIPALLPLPHGAEVALAIGNGDALAALAELASQRGWQPHRCGS
ncbi:MAG: bifunctional precorrin-2 dehydrogenase/sirohydrochlorin ferrochelatase [Gammaproteobacteria bacterium]|nr:bifunctional precorrin-2 dehydrogenase/sirohydrochlorin ferrochelatase [Gammaproteobacteria bacterium]